MSYWSSGFVLDLLLILALLVVASWLRLFTPLRRFGLPDAIVAGLMGLALGPTGAGLLPVHSENLEVLVYHGVALIFIAITLQSPPPGRGSRGAVSCAFAIPVLAAIQGIIGLTAVLGWNALSETPLHTGVGMLLPLGFNQGPGSAMTLGAAWEASAGLTDGAQIGLIMAAAGFGWCCVGGLVLVAVARARGWTRSSLVPPRAEAHSATDLALGQKQDPAREPRQAAKLGRMEPLLTQLVTIGAVYLTTYVFLVYVTPLLPPKHQPTLWSLHFVVASGFALLARRALAGLPDGSPLHDGLLSRSSSVFVELTTASALVAVQLTVLSEWIGPIALISTLGGVLTAVIALWLAKRAFPDAPFEHSVVLFGAMTGTTATGLALLRLVDPDFRSPAARNFVVAATAATLLAGPMLALMPYAVLGYEDNYLETLLTTLGIIASYAVVLVVAWRRFGPLRLLSPLRSPWPTSTPP